MLDLRRDLFARLVISAQRDKTLNAQFKVVHGESKKQETTHVNTTIEPKHAVSRFKIYHHKPAEKIGDKVEKLINNTDLDSIKIELEFAEELLKKIKSKDKDNEKIPVIEKTIIRLKSLLEQKMSS